MLTHFLLQILCFLQARPVADTVVGMDVMTTLTGDHLDVHHTVVVEAILLVVLLTLKGQGGTDQGPTLLMEAQTEDMVVALVSMPDKKKLVCNLEMNGTKKPLDW